MILSMAENPQEIIDHGLLKGFNIVVVGIIVLQALNGLVRRFKRLSSVLTIRLKCPRLFIYIRR